jgi:hypothetical protein
VKVVLAVLVGVLGLVAVTSGVSGMLFGPSDAVDPSFALDSNFRFLSAFLAGAGGILLWSLVRLGRATTELRIISALVFLGGCARLASLATAGRPDAAYTFFITAELVLPVAIVSLQWRLVRVVEAPTT